jgi:predicted transcriptional regulator
VVGKLARMVLVNLSQGKTVSDVCKESGVDESIIIEKVRALKSRGFLTETGRLTEKGFEVLQSDESI